jgi:hypothetical protein
MVGVTLFKHCDAIALVALFLARSLAASLIFEDSFPAQAFSSPHRSCLRLNSVAVADADLGPPSKGTAKSTMILRAIDTILMVFGIPFWA